MDLFSGEDMHLSLLDNVISIILCITNAFTYDIYCLDEVE